jgi:hypothetical protein
MYYIFIMSGAGEGKHKLKNVNVFIHEKGKSGARITHIDIENEELSKIIKEGEITFVKGKSGGVFIALKKDMINRAERLLRKI